MINLKQDIKVSSESFGALDLYKKWESGKHLFVYDENSDVMYCLEDDVKFNPINKYTFY